MTRSMEAAAVTAAQAGENRPRLLCELDFPDGTLNLHSGTGPLSWDGKTWTGTGTLARVERIEESEDMRANGVRLFLAGIDSAVVSAALTQAYQGRSVKLWLAFMDDAEAVIDDPVLLFTGRMDVMTLRDEGSTATVAMTCESRLYELDRPRVRRYTAADQAIEYPNDRGFDFVERLQSAEIVFGQS